MIFCAEVGSNHKGIPALAYELIRQAKLAGADIVKFQFRDPDDPIRGLGMKCAWRLTEWCNYWDIEFMASIFSMDALQLARAIGMRRYKVAYSVADTKPHLIAEMIDDGKEIFVSHHGYCYPNIRNVFTIPQYPTYPEDLAAMPYMFGDHWFGYSSHVHGYADALVAIARGARYVEKHVTLDKTESSIKDNAFSLSFDEFHAMADIGRQIERICRGSHT